MLQARLRVRDQAVNQSCSIQCTCLRVKISVCIFSRDFNMFQLVIAYLLLYLAVTSIFTQSCSPFGSPVCTCRLEDSGKVIDLSSIGNRDGSPRFVHMIASDIKISIRSI